MLENGLFLFIITLMLSHIFFVESLSILPYTYITVRDIFYWWPLFCYDKVCVYHDNRSLRVVRHFLYSWLRILIAFLKHPVTQGLFDLFLILVIFKRASPLLILLKMWRNLDKLSFALLLLYKGSQFAFLNVFWKEILSIFLKSPTLIVSGMGLHFGSYTRLETGKWSAISTAILLLVLEVTKFEWIWSKQLIFVLQISYIT